MGKRTLQYTEPGFELAAYKKFYDVAVTVTTNNNNVEQKNTVSCNTEVHFLPQENNEWNIIVQKKNLQLNGSDEGAGLINELVLQTASVLEEIVFKTDEKRNLKAILNFEEIELLWLQERADIELTYGGDIVEDLLNAMEEKLKSKETLMDALLQDPFIIFYLNNSFAVLINPGREDAIMEIKGITGALPLFFTEQKLWKETQTGFTIERTFGLNKTLTNMLLLADKMKIERKAVAGIEAFGNAHYEVSKSFEINSIKASVTILKAGTMFKNIALLVNEI